MPSTKTSEDGPLLALMEAPVRARRKDPKTSVNAAKSVKAGSRRMAILGLMVNMLDDCRFDTKGWTTWEIGETLKLERDKVSPHMVPLERLGFIRRTGNTRARPGHHNESEIWVATDKGFLFIRQMVRDLAKTPAMGLHSQAAERLPASRLAIPFDTSDEIWKHLLDNPSWPPELEQFRNYEREDDMGDNILRVYVDDQGDVYVSTHIAHSARFCTKVGGGHSLRVRAALLYLAYAIMKDNGGKHAG